jgi:ferredoxin
LKFLRSLPLIFCSGAAFAQRFPKPDFESGYSYPQVHYAMPHEQLWLAVDVLMLVALMSVVAWAVVRRRVRMPVFVSSIISVAYFGFFRKGCVCAIGSIQNVALALSDSSYAIAPAAAIFFVLPIVFTILFGRVFCSGVCPFGALQELVNVRNFRVPRPLAAALSVVPWLYLLFALLFALTHSSFIICRYDPFIGIFRLGGSVGLILSGVLLLVAAVFTGRPFCRFLCPYGALLSLFSRVSLWRVKVTPTCINCDLCRHACPVDAIRPPYDNKVKEARPRGAKRVLAYIVILPLAAAVGALLLRAASLPLSLSHKDVALYHLVQQNEKSPIDPQPVELEAFYGQGGKLDVLAQKAKIVEDDFRFYATIIGSLMGLVIGLTLLNLSLKRTRKLYEIADSSCVACGRCFGYCPQNQPKVEI